MAYDLRLGHCLDLIPKLTDGEVNVVVTSPPWYGADYDVPAIPGWGRLGHEPDPDAYVEHVAQIIGALQPKLDRTGVVWVAVGDVPGVGGRLQGLPQKIGAAAQLHRLNWIYTVYWISDSVMVPAGTVPFGPFRATVPILGLVKEPEDHYWREDLSVCDYLAYPPAAPEIGLPFIPLPGPVVGDLLEWTCPSGGTVVDPMCGSGTVPAVANVMGYYGVGMDLDGQALKRARQKCIRLKEEARKAIAARGQQMAGAVPPWRKESKN